MKKIIVLILVIIISFTTYLIVYLTPKNYQLEYKINNIDIKEEYLKKEKIYYFEIKIKDNIIPIINHAKYTRKRKLITKVEEYAKESNYYIVTILNKKYNYCVDKDTISSGINKPKPKLIEEYKNIKIYNNDNDYIIWNHKGFIKISKDKNQTYDLLKNDNYENSLAYSIDNYFIFPNYDSKYIVNNLYLFNNKEDSISIISTKNDISYDSYFMGMYNDNVYLLDRKNKKEYNINLERLEISEEKLTNEEIVMHNYKNDTRKSLNKVIKTKEKFKKNINSDYQIIDNKLYQIIKNIKIQISNQKVSSIIKYNDNEVYYLVKDKLYHFDYEKGEELLLSYSEWNFNFQNQIFIFNNEK